ncbi:hypothetical protein OsI_22893 [Oryza sativa Indica Group]|uniref:Uncharacterized protein n=1 Tax=Oryza sativa subsp. indica TaxID=39946 RepID=B8B1Q4_ORYSI|nr:hypothetical protein OsI_22893 [Oryza sativa Indica Group]
MQKVVSLTRGGGGGGVVVAGGVDVVEHGQRGALAVEGVVGGEEEDDDEEALRWTALEKLPTYDRVRRAILPVVDEGGGGGGGWEAGKKVVDVLSLDPVGIDIPTIEVRFEHLEAEVASATAASPPSSTP